MTDPLVVLYLAHCAQQRQPPNTIAKRRSILHNAPHPGAATRDGMEAWWQTRLDRDPQLAPSTLTADLAILRKFYAWLDVWEHRDADVAWPISRMEAPPVHKGRPRAILKPDLDKLLTELPPDLRRAVLLGAWAGLRVSEAAALPWANVDRDGMILSVEDVKDGGWRYVAADIRLLDELGEPRGVNVVTGTSHVYTAGALQRRANRAIQAVVPNADPPVTFHRLRHRYGTMAYRATGDLLAVGRQMGHRAVSSTQVYAEPSDDVARKIALAVTR